MSFTSLRRAAIVGLSTVLATTAMTGFAATAQADWAIAGGGIGLVDTDTVAAGTQGAKLLSPGVSGQVLGDIRLLIPNMFKDGDTIDLAIFDRSATTASNGLANADAAHRLGFTSAPTVTVNQTPFVAATGIGPTSGTAGNTEATPLADTTAGKATVPPTFTTRVVASSRANGQATDIIRMTVTGATSAANLTDKWMVTLSGVKADLGAAVSPGELRVVPFAYNGAPNLTGSNASTLFAGNRSDVDGAPATYDPKIGLYTVPAYVAPATLNVGAPNNIVADGTTQRVGDLTVAEAGGFSLQNGTYTVVVAGATVANGASSPITVTTANAATGESVASPAVLTRTGLKFTVAGASNTSTLRVILSGLLLSDSTRGAITYTLTGGSIGEFLAVAGSSPDIGAAPPSGVPADVAFGLAGAVNQDDIATPGLVVKAISGPIALRIGGIDRYQTAARVAAQNGVNDSVVLASGENFPDALSSGYLANQLGGASILLTQHSSLPAVTAGAMRTLGARTFYLVGGTGAVDASVEAQLLATAAYYPGGLKTVGQAKLQVIRLGGANRYATNRVVNERAVEMGRNGADPINFIYTPVGRTKIRFRDPGSQTAIFATGEGFADALAAGPATTGTTTGLGNLPLILTQGKTLSDDAGRQIIDLQIHTAVIVGGTGAVSAAVEHSINGENEGIAMFRLGGANRYETAAKIADFETALVNPTATVNGGLGFDAAGSHSERAYLVTGTTLADALAGAPLAGGSGSPILLTYPKTLAAGTKTWLTAHAAKYSTVVALGLAGAVSSATLSAANTAIAAP